MPEPQSMETYLGDGLYCRFDGYGFTLFASNGVETTDQVYLEPHVVEAFKNYIDAVAML